MFETQGVRRLYRADDVLAALQIEQDELDWLVNTDQIDRLSIGGEDRYDCTEIDGLAVDAGRDVLETRGGRAC